MPDSPTSTPSDPHPTTNGQAANKEAPPTTPLKHDRLLDWGKFHDFVMKKSATFLETVQAGDVDWILSDPKVDLTKTQLDNTEASTPTKSETPANASLTTPPSPQFAVSNSNLNSISKTKPAPSKVSDDQATSQPEFHARSLPIESRRRSSVSSIASANSQLSAGSGFLLKIKNKFHRTNSRTEPAPLTPLQEPQPQIFKRDFSFDSQPSQELTTSAPAKEEEPGSDPHLDECIRFFQKKPMRRSLSLSRRASVPLTQPISSRPNSEPQTPSKFNFLKRVSSAGSSGPLDPPVQLDGISSISEESSAQETPIQFRHAKPLRRVAFHSLTFLIDPPQQIPSRTPRKGNVEVLPNGVVRVNPLTEADKAAMDKSMRGQGGGLVVGGTGALGLIEKDSDEESSDEESSPVDEPQVNGKVQDDPETAIDKHAQSFAIDKPMVQLKPRAGYTVPIKKMALDLMYTRCCHLREIMPIPAIAKQIPVGSMAPLPLLQLRNPEPTMIEIQSFADFIRIAPILCISLDGVKLSFDQFKILLSAMSAKKQLEKLSLRNTPIDAEGWSLLCWFLSRNKVLKRLDVTQCPPLFVNVMKKRSKSQSKKQEEEVLTRMVCNNENRSDMDWSLFTATLVARGGIEELILTGCCINDLEVFEKLFSRAVVLDTHKLGLAYNQLTPPQLKIIFETWVFSGKCRGLDLGYNDLSLSAFLQPLQEMKQGEDFSDRLANSKIAFLSLNATNLRFNDSFSSVLESVLVKFPNLKYLDLSNNAKLFKLGSKSSKSEDKSEKNDTKEDFISFFSSKLPLCDSLIRLQLENNGLSSNDLITLFEYLPYCKNLAYLSIVGNDLDIYAASALSHALKSSRSLMVIDFDYGDLPEEFKERLGLYTMRNMERVLNQNLHHAVSDEKLSPTASEQSKSSASEMSIAEEMSNLLQQKADGKLDAKSPELLRLIEKVQANRERLRTAIADLFHLQWKEELTIEGKEALIRLLFIDSSLERGIRLIDPALVDQQAGTSSTEFIKMGSAEDEKNKLGDNEMSQMTVDASPSLLKPFNSGSVPISRSQSFTSLSNHDREEGSIMKLLKISKDAPEILEGFDVHSGEDIRRMLLDSNLADINEVILIMSTLKAKGVSMKNIFKIENGSESENKKWESGLFQELRSKIQKLQASTSQDEEISEKNEDINEDVSDINSAIPLKLEPREGRDQILEAYDRILSKFNSNS